MMTETPRRRTPSPTDVKLETERTKVRKGTSETERSLEGRREQDDREGYNLPFTD